MQTRPGAVFIAKEYQIAREVAEPYPQAVTPEKVPDFYVMPEEYDILHAAGSAAEVRVLERIEREHVPSRTRAAQRSPLPAGGGPGGWVGSRRDRPSKAMRPCSTWLEPACGTGRLLRLAAARNHSVIGFDLEARMVQYATRRVRDAISRGTTPVKRAVRPRASIFRADMTTFAKHVRAKGVDFAFNLINTIRHLPSDAAMLAHFEQIARVLRPGGVYAVGLSLSSYGNEIPTEDIWIGRRGRISVSQVVQYLPAPGGRGRESRMEKCINHMTVARGRRETEHDFVYTLRTYDLRQWTTLVGRSRLRIDAVLDDQGNAITPTEPGYAVYILRRRAD